MKSNRFSMGLSHSLAHAVLYQFARINGEANTRTTCCLSRTCVYHAHVVVSCHFTQVPCLILRVHRALSNMRNMLWLLGVAALSSLGEAFVGVPVRATALAAGGRASQQESCCASLVRETTSTCAAFEDCQSLFTRKLCETAS